MKKSIRDPRQLDALDECARTEILRAAIACENALAARHKSRAAKQSDRAFWFSGYVVATK